MLKNWHDVEKTIIKTAYTIAKLQPPENQSEDEVDVDAVSTLTGMREEDPTDWDKDETIAFATDPDNITI